MAASAQKSTSLDARLDPITMPESGAWLHAARQDALSRLSAMGLPGRRDEYWKYTDPTSLVSPQAVSAEVFNSGEDAIYGDAEQLRVVFVDGVFDADASDDLTLEGVEITTLAMAGDADIHWAKDVYGRLEADGQSPVSRPLAALNSAYASDGVLIHVTAKTAKPISFVYLHENTTSDTMLHHCIRLEKDTSLTVLESGPGAARFNTVTEVEIADGAAFHHIRVQGRDHQRRAATHLFTRLGTESLFKSFTLTMNGVMTRNECVISLNGDDAAAHVAGAAVGDGDFHHDDTVFVTHDALNCESRQVFKKVLRNGATGVFQGKILVKDGAQKTDGYQISQALLLDGDSQFLAKPELEIYADDVACSHGSTSGAIDEDALFYLRSRGVQEGLAQDMLVLSFLAEALDEIAENDIAQELLTRLENWLARRRTD